MRIKGYLDFHEDLKNGMPHGVYRGVPNDIYHSFPAISSSQMGDLMKSNEHWRAEQEKVREYKAHFDLGSALHTYTLERDRWNEDVRIEPEGINRRTNAGKEQWAAWLESSTGKTILQRKQIQTIEKMHENLTKNEDFREVMAEGVAETSIFGEMKGVDARCRPDWWAKKRNFLIDLKTTQDASPEKFPDHIYNFGYHRQAAFYMDLFKEVTGIQLDGYGIIAVETKPPYAVCSHQMHRDFLDIGREEYEIAIARYRLAIKEKKYSAYETGFHLAVPKPWMFYRTEQEDL